MKRVILIFAALLLIVGGQAYASCSDGELEYGDSCEDRFRSSDDPHIYGFEGEQGDIVTLTLTWEDDAEGQLVLAGPLIQGQDVFDVDERTSDDNGEVVLEEIELPEDGTYGIVVSFDGRVDYELTLEGESGGGSSDNNNDNEEFDTSSLGDSLLLFQAAAVPRRQNDGYYYDIETTTADGTEVVLDTNRDRYSNGCGDVSDDGRFIVYTTNADGNGESDYTHFEIYSARIDGSRTERLTETEADEGMPRWSPDGERVVFMSSEEPADIDSYEIFVMDADGDNLEQITDNNDADRFPSWSPDGERIIFHSNRDGDYELYTMTPEGDDVEQLTDNDWNDARAAYSPDGEQIVFNSDQFGFDDLFIMDADGDNIEPLTESDDNYEFGAFWSPDGERIAYTSTPDIQAEANEIWVVNVDGSDAQPVFGDDDVDYGLCDWGIIED
ncbi:MAG: hypothetical protein U0694_05790 [Anaerolineae bacterium]